MASRVEQVRDLPKRQGTRKKVTTGVFTKDITPLFYPYIQGDYYE
jgi:hypothetical protein